MAQRTQVTRRGHYIQDPRQICAIASRQLFVNHTTRSKHIMSQQLPSLSQAVCRSITPASGQFRRLQVTTRHPRVRTQVRGVSNANVLRDNNRLARMSVRFNLIGRHALPNQGRRPVLNHRYIRTPHIHCVLFRVLLPVGFRHRTVLLMYRIGPYRSEPRVSQVIHLQVQRSPFRHVRARLPFPPKVNIEAERARHPTYNLTTVSLPLVGRVRRFLFNHTPRPLIATYRPVHRCSYFLRPIRPRRLNRHHNK